MFDEKKKRESDDDYCTSGGVECNTVVINQSVVAALVLSMYLCCSYMNRCSGGNHSSMIAHPIICLLI